MPTPNQSPAPEHTPLPWKHIPQSDGRHHTVAIVAPWESNENEPYHPLIAYTVFGGSKSSVPKAVAEANAALIVRAVNALPAAVEALEIACRRIEGFDADGNLTDGICFSDEDRETIAAALRALKPE